jgi:small-conductance mechanosensitive channel
MLPTGQFRFADLWQLAVIGLSLMLFSRLFSAPAADAVDNHRPGPVYWLRANLSFLSSWLLSLLCFLVLVSTEYSEAFFRFFTFLGGIWILIGLCSSFIKEKFWAKSFAVSGYFLTFILAMAHFDGLIQSLQDLQIELGTLSISAWGIITGILVFAVAMWASLGLTRLLEAQIQTVPRMSASIRVLIVKICRILLIFIAGMIAMSSMGINLASLTVLGGAVGLGLGFGLQKVVSNFVSGIILLMDNSIKPGDVIEIDGTYGWINNLRARYASVITRDGTEHLIPNEDLITQRVINWSFTDNLVRIRVPIGVSYNADPHECIRLVLEAANSHERIMQKPEPVCQLKGFGDSSIDLELRFWLADPANGVSNVKSHVLLRVWDIFKENNIEIPFPQRDLHIRSSDVDWVKNDTPDPE